jgi:hypothetical protein
MDWYIINKIMCQLAKRKNPKARGWITKSHYTDECATCLVCGETIHYTKYLDHALLDIKKYNLLAYL